MGFKTILVPTEQHDLMSSTLETALVFARKFDSYIEGFALRAGVPVAFNNESRARSLFEEFMRERGVPCEGHAKTLSSAWLQDAPQGDSFVGSHGRVFDVIVLGRPGAIPRVCA